MDAKLEWEGDVEEAVNMMDRGEETQGRDSQGWVRRVEPHYVAPSG